MRQSSGSCSQIFLIVALTGVGMFLLSSSEPFTDTYFNRILPILVGILICYAGWLLVSSIIRQRRTREQHPHTVPVDRMARRLERGDTPHLGADGEIYFTKRSKHAKHPRHH